MTDDNSEKKLKHHDSVVKAEALRREGNTCIGLGTGVGVLGVGSAAITGATCPLCIFVVPTLIGLGVAGRLRAKKLLNANLSTNKEESV